MAERVDVCIVGSGFGGAISAWRLAELYVAAGVDPAGILVLERGRRFKHTDFRQSWDVEHLSNVYELVQSTRGTGAQMVIGRGVGGSSNLYLAASLRSPSDTFERRDRHPDDGPDRRMWPAAITRRTLDPYYARAERALRVRQPGWNEVSRPGGLWAASLRAAGHSCDRVPVAIDFGRCVDANWCATGCIFGAKNGVITNYLAASERAGVRVRDGRQAESVRRAEANASGYRYVVTASVIDHGGERPTRQPTGVTEEIECKVLILAAGAMGTPPILMRSRSELPSLSAQVGRHLGINGDHITAVEFDPAKVRRLLGLPGYGAFFKGKPITTMTYDFWRGRGDRSFDGRRFTLQEILIGTLSNYLYDDGREPAGEPSFWGLQKKQSLEHWDQRIEVLCMVEDTHDGEFYAVPPQGGAIRPNAGPLTIGLFGYEMTEASRRVRDEADAAIRGVVERGGLARFLKVTASQGEFVAHPLGGCRMADSKDLGVVDDSCEAFDNEGLFCIDSSAIPTSLGVNPSLTISAISERAAERMVARGGDLGLPAPPAGFRHGAPPVVVGERVVPPIARRRRRRRRRRRARR